MQNLLLSLLLCFTLTGNAQQKAKKVQPRPALPTAVVTEEEKTYRKLIMIADDLAAKKQFTLAAGYFTKALAYNIEVPETTLKRAMAYFYALDYTNAIPDFTTVLATTTDPANIYFLRGISKLNSPDKTGACDDLIKAKELGKTFEDPTTLTKFCGTKQ